MKIYTRKGDGGRTCLPDGSGIAKDAAVMEVCGTLDELSAALGLVRAERLPGATDALIEEIQRTLLRLGGEIVMPDLAADASQAIGPQHITALEAAIDGRASDLPPLRAFVLPGNTRAEAALHLARTVCRRAERRMVSLVQAEPQRVAEHHLSYLNRLSDLLFVLARCMFEPTSY